MFKHKKEAKLIEDIKTIWENDHAEEVTEAYNEIVKIMATLDTYSANMVINLVFFQTIKKTLEKTVGGEK